MTQQADSEREIHTRELLGSEDRALLGKEQHKKLLGILSLSLLQLGFEFLIMKVARYQFGTLYIGVIAVGLLGVAAAALSVRLFRKSEFAIATACVALPCVAWLCLGVQTAQGFGGPTAVGSGLRQFSLYTNLAVTGILAFVVLALCSVPIFAYIYANIRDIHRYYAASFIGGAIGIPVTMVMLEMAGDLLTGTGLLLLTIIPPLVLITNLRVRTLAAVFALAAAITSVPVFESLDRRAHPKSLYRQSDALSRIDVVRDESLFAYKDDPSFDERMAIAFYQGGKGGRTRASPIAVEGPTIALSDESEEQFPPSWILSPKKALVLGSGAGIELMKALRSGATEVHAVEIDRKVLDYVHRLAPATHNPYANPKVIAYRGEGRDISAQIGRREGATFDLVYIPTALLRAQSSQVFAQTHLVTEEALYQYLGLLNEAGVLGVAFPLPREFRARMTVAMARALERRGIREPEEHIRVIEDLRSRWIVFGKVSRPFTDAETALMLGKLNQFRLVDVSNDLQIGSRMQPFNDNNPFLFPSGLREALHPGGRVTSPGVQSSFDWDRRVITVILASAVLLILGVFCLGILAAGKGYRTPRAGYLACFTMIGGGYVIYQTLMLQRLSFLVGHPMLATAFILTTALLASGFGSWLSGKHLGESQMVRRAIGTAVLVLWIISLCLIKAEQMIQPAVRPLWRTLAAIVLCAPPFVMMGTYFAVAMKRAEREAPGCISWGWGLNGIAAIAGWSFMVGGSMNQGIRFVGLSAALVYATVGTWELLTVNSVGQRTRTLVHRAFAIVAIFALIATVYLSR
jgi:hypothetical protein